MAILLLLKPSYAESAKELTHYSYREQTIVAIASPYTTESVEVIPIKKKVTTRTSFRKDTGNCVSTVRNAGYFVPRTIDGYARTIPVSSKAMPPEGKTVVIKTAESKLGHVLVAKNVGGKLVSIVEGNHPIGEGRTVPLQYYRGYIIP